MTRRADYELAAEATAEARHRDVMGRLGDVLGALGDLEQKPSRAAASKPHMTFKGNTFLQHGAPSDTKPALTVTPALLRLLSEAGTTKERERATVARARGGHWQVQFPRHSYTLAVYQDTAGRQVAFPALAHLNLLGQQAGDAREFALLVERAEYESQGAAVDAALAAVRVLDSWVAAASGPRESLLAAGREIVGASKAA